MKAPAASQTIHPIFFLSQPEENQIEAIVAQINANLIVPFGITFIVIPHSFSNVRAPI
jgi:hypothetical protein